MPKVIDNRYKTYERWISMPYGGQISTSENRHGYAGTLLQVTHYPEERRRKPADLFREGTALGVYYSKVVDPMIERITHTQYETLIHQFPASLLGAADTAVLPSDDRVRNQVLNQLIQRIKNQNVNLAVSLAEYRSTANTVADLARNISRVIVQPKARLGLYLAKKLQNGMPHTFWRTRVKRLRSRRERDAVNSFLAYSYGLRPIMSDIHGSLKSLNETLADGYEQRVRLSLTKSTTNRVTYPEVACEGTLKTSFKVDCKYVVNANVQRLAQVGITNPASAAYELIPYSFVFDWVIPVGDYLASLDASIGIESIIRIEGLKEQRDWFSSKGNTVHELFKARSAPISGLPTFQLMYTPSDSVTNLVSAIALLRQRSL